MSYRALKHSVSAAGSCGPQFLLGAGILPSDFRSDNSRAAGRQSSTPGGAVAVGSFAATIAGAALGYPRRAPRIRGDSPRSGERVWRNSYYVGQIEERIWKPISDGSRRGGKRWTAALLKAAKQFEIRTRAERRQNDPGARNGELGEVGIAVLEYLYGTVDYATGRLEPAIRTIADAIGRAYSAVHRALKRLRRHGFIHWMRRSKPIDNPEPDGPQVEQASNAYALLCPKVMRGWLAKLIGKPPAPECDADRRKRERADFEAMLDGLSAEERMDATWQGDDLLGETLRSLAASVDARDRKDRESSGSDETGGV